MIEEFDVDLPEDLEGAIAALAGGGDGTLALSGGTNLLVDLRARRQRAERLVSLARVPGLRSIEATDGRVAIGARTTVSDVLHHPGLAETAPALVAAARIFGGQMVRNAATVAGNVAYGSPAADLMPPLLSLDAELEVTGPAGRRSAPLDGFFTGYRENGLAPGELITGIGWAAPAAPSANLFYKLGLRKGDAIAVVCLAVTLAGDGDRVGRARIALGAVAATVFRAKEAEDLLVGARPDAALIEEASRVAADATSPIDDVRASAAYRRRMVHVLTRRLLGEAWQRIS